MNYQHNGESIRILPPLKTISVNKYTVVFTDLSGQQRLQLNDSVETNRFVKWLTSPAIIN